MVLGGKPYFYNMKYIVLISVLFASISCNYFQKDEPARVPKDALESKIFEIEEQLIDSPRNARLYSQRGQLYWKRKENEKALNDFYKMVSYDSSKAEYFEILSDFFADNLNIDRAIAALDHAIKIDPYSPRYHVKQGKYCVILKKYQDAINHLNNALKRDKFNPEAYLYKGIIYMESNNDAKAISNFITASEQDPTWDQPFELLGQIYAKQKNDLCLQYFDNASRANTNNTTAISQKAFYYKTKGNLDKAAEIYNQQVIKNAQDANALYNLGVILFEKKDLKGAQSRFEMCIAVDPSNALAYYMIGKVKLSIGNKKEAKKAFEQSFVFDTTLIEAKTEANKL